MDRRTITLVAMLFLLIIAGMFIFAYLKKQEIAAPTPIQVVEDISAVGITRIDAKHFYEEGTHTFVGELDMPTPCDLLEVGAVVMESMPEQVRLDFTVINNADTCIQVVTAQRFQVEAKASADAKIAATFMGKAVELNLIPAAPGESPEDFELFIKG